MVARKVGDVLSLHQLERTGFGALPSACFGCVGWKYKSLSFTPDAFTLRTIEAERESAAKMPKKCNREKRMYVSAVPRVTTRSTRHPQYPPVGQKMLMRLHSVTHLSSVRRKFPRLFDGSTEHLFSSESLRI